LPLSPFLIYDAVIKIRVTKLSKLLVIFAGLSLFVAVSVTSADFTHAGAQASAAEWQRYKVDGEEFSVLLPVAPAMSTTSIQYERNKTRRERTLAAYADGVVYTIHTVEKKSISLDEWINRTGSGGRPEGITVDRVPGKGTTGETDNTIWHSKWLETTRNLYKFSATAAKLGDHSAGISKFFSSISFSKNSEGRNLLDGPGEQPLTHGDGAEPDSVLRNSQVTVRWKVVSKPEPSYTEQARQNQVTGTVVLRGIFSSSGAVENITVLRGLPEGLTERSVDAARKIRFIPAIKDGRFVSMWMQLEYNFNLY